ncbi:helix-turn-helix domain-containing protein [Salinispora sp. H7-4]|uniref:helix-turn-helix domain-containing protein n=1 Tax=Salinispora sp. H7-4 TaxID=2748321 RepID=UPI0015D1F5E2|nr:helix-turn-helix transcriptional regulator [Salinispora sp. H7-4]NYT94020.1 helix-turn-helix transcriptional regulator [Salinispora sp. H7-4]
MPADTIGARIRYWRLRRGGMSQTVLAGLAGLSQPFISQVESGRRSIDRRSTLIAIAAALQVTVADLLEQPGSPTDPALNGAADAVPAIWAALLEISDGDRGAPTMPSEQVTAVLRHSNQKRLAGDYPAVARGLPPLLDEAARHGGAILAEAAYQATTCLRHLGQRHLAVDAARIAQTAAEDVDHHAWRGAARFGYVQALPVEAAGVASRVAGRAMDDLQQQAANPQVRQVLGQLHLAAALRATSDGRTTDARGHLVEAEREAATLGDPGPGGGFNAMCFGPTNVVLWQMAIAAEVGEYGRVIEFSRTVSVDALPIANRRQAYWMDLGRALAHSGRTDTQALAAFSRADQIAPSLFVLNPLARDAVAAMIRRARRRAVSKELRILARRLSIAVEV